MFSVFLCILFVVDFMQAAAANAEFCISVMLPNQEPYNLKHMGEFADALWISLAGTLTVPGPESPSQWIY